jgi:hypothetical protein
MHWPSFKHCTLQNFSNGDAVTGLTVCCLSPERGHGLKGKFHCYGGINSVQKVFYHATYSLFSGLNDLMCHIQCRNLLHYVPHYVVVWVMFSVILFTVKTAWSQTTHGLFHGLNGGVVSYLSVWKLYNCTILSMNEVLGHAIPRGADKSLARPPRRLLIKFTS